jgi:hypothetical protein
MLADLLWKSLAKRMKEASFSKKEIKDVRARVIKKQPFAILKNKNIDLEGEKLPALPLTYEIESKTAREIWHAKEILGQPYKLKQKNRQLAESLLLEIKIDANAEPGERYLRLSGRKGGRSNPILFKVGELTEQYEAEPNSARSFEPVNGVPELNKLLEPKPLKVPFVMNGQIMPGDADRFRFEARKGQKILIEVEARRLMPYLADAVPGWFQAVAVLYDSAGRELAYADDHLINPDPVLYYEVPEHGEYELEIRDSIYRGRQDFVYRIKVTDAPWARKELAEGSGYGDRWSRKDDVPAGRKDSELIPADVLALPKGRDRSSNDSIGKAAYRWRYSEEGRCGCL